jgi:hypothetical protein
MCARACVLAVRSSFLFVLPLLLPPSPDHRPPTLSHRPRSATGSRAHLTPSSAGRRCHRRPGHRRRPCPAASSSHRLRSMPVPILRPPCGWCLRPTFDQRRPNSSSSPTSPPPRDRLLTATARSSPSPLICTYTSEFAHWNVLMVQMFECYRWNAWLGWTSAVQIRLKCYQNFKWLMSCLNVSWNVWMLSGLLHVVILIPIEN